VIHNTPLLRRNNDSSWLAHTHTHANRQTGTQTHTHTHKTPTHVSKYENLASCPDLAVSLRIPVYHPAACITSTHLRHLFIRQQTKNKPSTCISARSISDVRAQENDLQNKPDCCTFSRQHLCRHGTQISTMRVRVKLRRELGKRHVLEGER